MNTINVEAGDMGLVVGFVLLIGGVIKNYTPVDNKFIPLITWALGGLLYQWLSDGWTDPRQWMMALLSVAGATGLHSATRTTAEIIKPAGTVPLILLVGLLPFTGCALFNGDKLEAGGAYAATETAPAQPELFALDASFDLAHSGLDTVFKFERDNRAMLWSISPDIKRRLDQLRVEARVVKRDYATARTAYLASPSPAGLDQLNHVIGKLHKANAAALAVLQTKGIQP